MALVVGPVIGLVTASTARILIEAPEAAEVTLTLRSEIGIQCMTQAVPANRATIFPFTGLSPSTRYTVEAAPFSHPPASFRTFPEHLRLEDRPTLGIVSCNNLRITNEVVAPDGCVWRGTANLIREGKIDLLLHIGDQVYGDDDWSNYEDGKLTYAQIAEHCTYAQANELLGATPKEEWPALRRQVNEMYRQCYRDAWGAHGPTREALANCPSIMIYDDHDMRDDLGDKAGEFDLASDVRFIVDCGRRAAFEYQRQLYEDFDLEGEGPVPPVQRENHLTHVLGDIGLLFVDSRGAKTFNRVADDPRPFLTSAQWEDITAALSPEGPLAECKVLFMLTQIPLVFFGQRLTEAIAAKADDFEGMWSYKQNHVEQLLMLEALWEWRNARPGRTVVLAGGDVHLGGFCRVYRNGELAFEQLTCGPVSNTTIKALELLVTNSAKEVGESLGGGWTCEHDAFSNKRNVGLVYFEPGEDPVSWAHLMGTTTLEVVECGQQAHSKGEMLRAQVANLTNVAKSFFGH